MTSGKKSWPLISPGPQSPLTPLAKQNFDTPLCGRRMWIAPCGSHALGAHSLRTVSSFVNNVQCHNAVYATNTLIVLVVWLTRFAMGLMIQMLIFSEWGAFDRGSCPRFFLLRLFPLKQNVTFTSTSPNKWCMWHGFYTQQSLIWKDDASRMWWCHGFLFSSHTSLMYQI